MPTGQPGRHEYFSVARDGIFSTVAVKGAGPVGVTDGVAETGRCDGLDVAA